MEPIRVALLTVSDGVARGTRADVSGTLLREWVQQRGHALVAQDVVADDAAAISARLTALAQPQCDVVLTTGGTGLTARDVTPEATNAVIERVVPGITEALRMRGAQQTRYAWLSRGVAGIRGRTLIINLPGSESAVRDGLQFLDDVLAHAVQLLRGVETHKHTE